MIPIALRHRNRPAYLDVTLKSLWHTDLPEGCPLVILDDCSDDALTKQYLTTDDEIVLPETQTWLENNSVWDSRVGMIDNISKLRGIASRAEVAQPENWQGVRGGIFWCIWYMMNRFPDEQAVIIIEADSIFNQDWYTATMRAYEACKDQTGPNGDSLGLLSCYDRKGKPPAVESGWGWRSVRQLGSGHWNCGNGIGGVMYLVTRTFFELDDAMRPGAYSPGQRGGDTTLQGHCGHHKLNIAITSPSFCQHIGIASTAWPGRGWRFARNFKQPAAFENRDANGTMYSEDWR